MAEGAKQREQWPGRRCGVEPEVDALDLFLSGEAVGVSGSPHVVARDVVNPFWLEPWRRSGKRSAWQVSGTWEFLRKKSGKVRGLVWDEGASQGLSCP